MITVTKKDSKESTENILRRFNRKVQQSGILMAVKELQEFKKPISKRERRIKAVQRKERRAIKFKRERIAGKPETSNSR
jgi:ribosomal protein S21